MTKFLHYGIVLFVAFLLQGAMQHFPFISVRCDLVWLTVIYLGFSEPLFPGALWVFLIAITEESLGAPLHGILPVSYLMTFFFLRSMRTHLFFEGRAVQALWVILLSLARRVLEQALLVWQGFPDTIRFGPLLATALLEAILSIVLFSFLSRGEKVPSTYGA